MAKKSKVATLADLSNSVGHKILILDPRQYDNILDSDTKSKVVRIFVFLKKLSEKWFTHILLLAFLIAYACIGAAIFESVEGGFEKEQNAKVRELREPINNLTEQIVTRMVEQRMYYPVSEGDGREMQMATQWDAYMRKELARFEAEVAVTCKKGLKMGISQYEEITKWTFMGGLFFSMTVFTTIGYGDNPPKTTAGQAITMVYAFVGIPLLLMVLADMGRIFTRGIKFVFKYIRRLYYTRSLRKVRRVGRTVGNMGRRATLQLPVKYMDSALTKGKDAINKGVAYIPYANKTKDPNVKTDDHKTQVRKTPTFVVRDPRLKMPYIIRTDPTPPATATQPSPPVTPLPDDYLDMDDEFNLPISLALIILMIYLLIGAILFWSTERWTLFHAFYFVFISMSTIGFGDYVPSNQTVLLAAFIYLLFGLALTSMCINVIQIKLSATFQKAKILVGESIGLDVEQIMAEEMAAEAKEKEKEKSRDPSVDKGNQEQKGKSSSEESSVERNDKNKLKKNSISGK